MLLELELKSFALVDHLVLEFGPGLTVLTGETGAGKSVILDSLTFLLGTTTRGLEAKAACRVAGRFQPTQAVRTYLESQGLPWEEEELVIVRERKEGGRTTSRLNGSIVSSGQLVELSELLVDLHGQHQSYALTKPTTHLPMLDRLAGAKQASELSLYGRLFEEYREIQKQIASVQRAERERLREIEWLKLELEEIDKVKPKPGEAEGLEHEIKRRAAAEDLARGSARVVATLGQERGVLDGLADALVALQPLLRFDETLSGIVERLRGAEIELQEVLREMTDYGEGLEHDPGSLDAMQQRAETLKGLCRKYGPTVEEVLAHREQLEVKLDRLENSEKHLQELVGRLAGVRERLTKSAHKLRQGRRKAAGDLGTELVAELSQLAMPKVAFQVDFEELEEFAPDGLDRAQFLFSPNPGRPPVALAETASGGELSRVMLGLVSILSRFQERPTLVLDEIDAGLGGRTAEAVASKLSRLGQKVQVLCVTHLPVVAAAGDGHLVVEKRAGEKSTLVTVSQVDSEGRVDEVARMLSGDSSQRRARDLAVELLAREG